mmetsp:Transcript_15360/g.19751  ORF Transcript_15360/g.19751 Transcript_15360/m.19751 type:complete len:286 (+) Transcript_15360:116-973(+)
MAPNNTRVSETKMILDKEDSSVKDLAPKDAHHDDEQKSSVEDSKPQDSDALTASDSDSPVAEHKDSEPDEKNDALTASDSEPPASKNCGAEANEEDNHSHSPPPNINPGTIAQVCLQVLRHYEGRYMRAREVLDATDVWNITAKNRAQSVGYALLSLSKGDTIKRKKEGGAVSYCLETPEGTDGARDSVQIQSQTPAPHLTTQDIVLTLLYFNQDRHMTAEQVYRATNMWNLTSAMPVPSVARVLRNLCAKKLVTMEQQDGIGAYKIKKGATFSLVKYTLSKESK